jgi:hypothetical protein
MKRTRAEAILAGDSHYKTWKPCKHGHLSHRGTLDGSCVECARLRQKGKRAEVRQHMEAVRRSA